MVLTTMLVRSIVDKPSLSSYIRCASAGTTISVNDRASPFAAAAATPSIRMVTAMQCNNNCRTLRTMSMSSMIPMRYHHRREQPQLQLVRQTPQLSTTHQLLHRRNYHRMRFSSLQSWRPHSTMPSSTTFLDETTDDTTASSNDSYNSTSTPFLLADIGEGITEVELLQWYIQPGDTVAQFDRICEVQSDKAAVEITSRFDGVVERLCGNVGDMMGVGRPLLYITTGRRNGSITSSFNTTTPAAAATAAANNVAGLNDGVSILDHSNQDIRVEVGEGKRYVESTLHNVDDEFDRLRIPAAGTTYPSYDSNDSDVEAGKAEFGMSGNQRNISSSSSSISSSSKVLTSPAVRKLSKENQIDLGRIQGSGKGGRVLKGDILKIIDPNHDNNTNIGSGSMPIANNTINNTNPTMSNTSTTTPLIPMEDSTVVVPIRGYNRQMVKSMTLSLQVPHMVYSDEINVDALTDVRDSLRPLATEMGITKKLSHMPFFIKATSLALLKYPIMNSTIDVENMTLTYHNEHRIGVAVDTARGLTVPVIGMCQEKSVLEIALELNRLYSLAMDGNLSEADIAKPTFTLSNIGAIGGTYMSPVVLPPQVGIGAMGKIHRVPRFVDDESDKIEAVRVMPISWGGDHRAVDGATIARFSNLWKSYCENPASMMFAMR